MSLYFISFGGGEGGFFCVYFVEGNQWFFHLFATLLRKRQELHLKNALKLEFTCYLHHSKIRLIEPVSLEI